MDFLSSASSAEARGAKRDFWISSEKVSLLMFFHVFKMI